jgi:hypothetical protein
LAKNIAPLLFDLGGVLVSPASRTLCLYCGSQLPKVMLALDRYFSHRARPGIERRQPAERSAHAKSITGGDGKSCM